jgi:hypothetical protein
MQTPEFYNKGFQNQLSSQMENKLSKDYYNDLLSLQESYAQGGMDEGEYRERLKQKKDALSAAKFQPQRNKQIADAYAEKARMTFLNRQGQISNNVYREESDKIKDRVNTLKGITSFSKPGFQIPAPKKINNGIYGGIKLNPYLNNVVGSPDAYDKTKTGWKLANNQFSSKQPAYSQPTVQTPQFNF